MKASGIRPQASGLSEASGSGHQETGSSQARAFASRVAALLLFVLAATAAGCEQPRAASETAFVGPAPPVRDALALPNRPASIKFAAIGDAGRGDRAQYDVSAQMQRFRDVFDFDFVVMLGDNVYDGGTPRDYRLKFELPYKRFLDEGVEFYATIGNHDDPNQPQYAPFNMRGQRYYTFVADGSLLSRLTDTDVRFFMIDTEALERTQLTWLDRELGRSRARWNIPVFHRPIYTSGRYRLPAQILRTSLEPVLLRHDVRLALSGHEHFYLRTEPRRGVTYFISGAAGSLRRGDLRRSRLTADGFDADYHFMLFEVTRNRIYYQAISRTGHSIDSGVIDNDDE
jgi:3',5'-cyclic AMP phosphodiesterase CpdA